MPHQLTDRVKLLHKVTLMYDGKVLLLKRSEDSASRPGKWDLPGGNSEWPSDVEHSVANLHTLDIAREIWEETGLRIEPSRFIRENLAHFSTFFDVEKQIYTVICGWSVKNLTENQVEAVTISDEHSEFVWAALSELNTYDFGGNKGDFIVDIIEQAFA